MTTENKKGKRKNRQIWGWISTVIGGLLILAGIFSVLACYQGCDPDLQYFFSAFTVIFMVGGIPLLLLGFNRIRKEKQLLH